MSREAGKETVKPAGDQPQMQLKWDDTNMKTSYANVCNVMSTREEVVLMFGVNQAWHAGQKEVTIQPSIDYVLNKRINLKFFFDQRRVTPYISTSAPVTNTRAGVNVRISLAQ